MTISDGDHSSDFARSSERHRRPARRTVSLGASLSNIKVTRESPTRFISACADRYNCWSSWVNVHCSWINLQVKSSWSFWSLQIRRFSFLEEASSSSRASQVAVLFHHRWISNYCSLSDSPLSIKFLSQRTLLLNWSSAMVTTKPKKKTGRRLVTVITSPVAIYFLAVIR